MSNVRFHPNAKALTLTPVQTTHQSSATRTPHNCRAPWIIHEPTGLVTKICFSLLMCLLNVVVLFFSNSVLTSFARPNEALQLGDEVTKKTH